MRTTCSSTVLGGLCDTALLPGQRPSLDRDPLPNSVDRMTDAYENITLPKISFAGANKKQTITFFCMEGYK